MAEGKEEGLKEGLKEGLIKAARGMKQAGMTCEIIVQATGLSEETVENL
jgi:predicted transposase/invertase (TIGR01784 family)